jgi:hypothetical protein
MGKRLTERTHRKLLKMHKALGKEIHWRSRLGMGRTLAFLSDMHELVIRRDAWVKRK